MPRCEVCQNEYDKAFTVMMNGSAHIFDCFECAIDALAPRCAQCGVRIIGHGFETDQDTYCCANCVRLSGDANVTDRIDGGTTINDRVT